MSETQVPIAIGIDVGGSGIKGAAVDVTTGRLAGTRLRVPTPQPSTPEACIAVITRMVKRIVKELPAAAGAPAGERGDDFIGVHVGRRARAGLKNVDGEMLIMLPYGNLRRRRFDRRCQRRGIARLHQQRGALVLGELVGTTAGSRDEPEERG